LAGGRGQGEKRFEPCLLFLTQFGFIVPTYLNKEVKRKKLKFVLFTFAFLLLTFKRHVSFAIQ
ncbi:MAG: hypothetical protein PUP93_15585, partial [Rhizonema sp. NSF051]|nr:hypothetical protein [Rhizonema sp. NSF051]